MKLRVPPGVDLYREPALGPLVLLEIAAVVVTSALRAQHVALEGDADAGESDEVTAARAVMRTCHELRHLVRDYRRRVLARLQAERSAWPF